MNIYINHLLSAPVLNFVTNSFQKLTPLQKKVSIIALVCVGYLALFFLASCLASWDLPENKKIVKPKVNKPQREIPNLEKLEPKEEIEKKNNDAEEFKEVDAPAAKDEKLEQVKHEALQLGDIFNEAKKEHDAHEAIKVQEAKVEEDAKILGDVIPAEMPINNAREYRPDRRINEIALAAIRNNGLGLKFIPKEMRNDDLYLAAIQRD